MTEKQTPQTFPLLECMNYSRKAAKPQNSMAQLKTKDQSTNSTMWSIVEGTFSKNVPERCAENSVILFCDLEPPYFDRINSLVKKVAWNDDLLMAIRPPYHVIDGRWLGVGTDSHYVKLLRIGES